MTYLFDIGNVLLAFDFTPALCSLLGPSPHPEALEKIIERKDDFEAGRIPTAEYIDWASSLLDFRGDHAAFTQAWTSIFTPIPATWELAKRLKAEGHRLILFSNTNTLHGPYCLEAYPDFSLFDAAVFSYEIGAIKPHEDFFSRAFNEFNIIPEETIYIDDLPENIDQGKRMGLHSFCYNHQRHHELEDWLREQPLNHPSR